MGFATIGGAILGAVALLPRPTVEAGTPTNQLNPLTAPFVIGNGNIIPLEHIQVGIGLCEISAPSIMAHGPDACPGELKSILIFTPWDAAQLDEDEKYTITPNDAIKLSTKAPISANIAIVVIYQPWFLPISRQKQFRFVSHDDGHGGVTWFARPSENRHSFVKAGATSIKDP